MNRYGNRAGYYGGRGYGMDRFNEARDMFSNYRMNGSNGYYNVSTRGCGVWGRIFCAAVACDLWSPFPVHCRQLTRCPSSPMLLSLQNFNGYGRNYYNNGTSVCCFSSAIFCCIMAIG